MTNEIRQSTSFAQILLIVVKYLVFYLAYNPLTGVVLICTFFMIFSLINFTGGELGVIGLSRWLPYLKWIGLSANMQLEKEDILSIYFKLSLVMFLLIQIANYIVKVGYKRKLSVQSKIGAWWGVGVISALAGIAMTSTFMHNMPDGADQVREVLILFWVLALILYLFYYSLAKFGNSIGIWSERLTRK